MSDQDSHTMGNLNHAVKVAESAHQRHGYNFRPRKTQAQIAKEGFPRFKNLPPEIRSKIWQDAMPPYGIYTALMLGREEPMPQQPPAPAPMAFRVVYHLEPVPRDQQDDEFRTRLDDMRSIQHVSSEAAFEVQRAFPTTINCTGGKLRFNAAHDILNLSDLQCLLGSGFLKRFKLYSQGGVVFADDWNKLPRAMWFNNRTLWATFSRMARGFSPSVLQILLRRINAFLDFLADCTNLKTLGIVSDSPAVFVSRLLDHQLKDLMPSSLLVPVKKGQFYQQSWYFPAYGSPRDFIEAVKGLKALTNGLDPAQGVPDYLQSVNFHHPRLQNLQVLTVLPASRTVRDEVMLHKEDHDL